MTYFDYTLSTLQNFEKTIWSQKTWMKFIGTICLLKVLKNWQSVVKICHEGNVRYQMSSAYPDFKINCEETGREKQKIQYSKLDLSLSVHMQSAVLLPLCLVSIKTQTTRRINLATMRKLNRTVDMIILLYVKFFFYSRSELTGSDSTCKHQRLVILWGSFYVTTVLDEFQSFI